MNQAIGLLEVLGLSSAIEVADTMLKSANVKFKTIEKTRGNGWMVVIVEGDVGAVNASVNSGVISAKKFGKFVSSKVIPRPVDGLSDVFISELTEGNTMKNEGDKSASKAQSSKKTTTTKVSQKKQGVKKEETKKKTSSKIEPKKREVKKATSKKTEFKEKNKAKAKEK